MGLGQIVPYLSKQLGYITYIALIIHVCYISCYIFVIYVLLCYTRISSIAFKRLSTIKRQLQKYLLVINIECKIAIGN